jgi:hypothetical protein
MKYLSVALVVLVAFLMQGTVAISHAADVVAIPDLANNVAAEKTDEALPASLASVESEEATIRTSAIPLTPEEQTVLTAIEATETPEVMNQTAGKQECYDAGAGQVRCEEVNRTKHPNFNTGIIGALGGGVIGLLGGAPGAAIGAVVGFTIFYSWNRWLISEHE